mmetsp:Transcript_2309/g.4050  ORF Transcript_2309/g.4050 Transcript_2309/m.4050 type:complete len:241 (-) Transcript_2309:24-746(-)
MDLLLSDGNIGTGPPRHLIRLLDEVVTDKTRNGEDWYRSSNKVLLPTDTDKHILCFVSTLIVTFLRVFSHIAIHLVHTDDQLLDSQQVEKTSVLTGLSLNNSSLVVTLCNGSGKVSISGNHQETNICLRSSGNHVLDEITMPWSIDDGVMVTIRVELLGSTCDGDTTSAFFLGLVHVESESKGSLTESISFSLELFKFTIGDSSQLENQTSSGSGLTSIDVSADHNGNVSLLCHFLSIQT